MQRQESRKRSYSDREIPVEKTKINHAIQKKMRDPDEEELADAKKSL